MRKGDIVRLNINVCFTNDQGGSLRFPLTNSYNDTRGIVEGFYKLTQEERQERREMEHYKGFDDAGEPRLVPSEGCVSLHMNRVYPVLRSRVRAVYNYRNRSGLALVLDTHTGRKIYVDRDLLEVLE